jgi:hypothetical protein
LDGPKTDQNHALVTPQSCKKFIHSESVHTNHFTLLTFNGTLQFVVEENLIFVNEAPERIAELLTPSWCVGLLPYPIGPVAAVAL